MTDESKLSIDFILKKYDEKYEQKIKEFNQAQNRTEKERLDMLFDINNYGEQYFKLLAVQCGIQNELNLLYDFRYYLRELKEGE